MAELLNFSGASTRQQFVIALLLTAGVFFMVHSYFSGAYTLDDDGTAIMLLVIREWISTIAFMFGSSVGSRNKDRPPSPPTS